MTTLWLVLVAGSGAVLLLTWVVFAAVNGLGGNWDAWRGPSNANGQSS